MNKRKKIAALPVGVHRANDGKGYEAVVLERRGFVRLGVFVSKRAAAVAARRKYWKERAA